MLEKSNIKLGDKSVYQLKNIREIHELLRLIKTKYGLIYPEKSYNDLLFNEMLKRETYLVPIFGNSIPILIYMCYYHNNPCVFIISLQSLETIYILPTIINMEYDNILLYGELIKNDKTTIYIERVLYIENRAIHYYKYVKHIELLNKFYNIIQLDWIKPKPIYNIVEMEKLVEDNNPMIGMRFYSFKNPVVFYKNTKDLKNKVINDIKLLDTKEHWIKKDSEMKNITSNNLSFNIDFNKIYDLRITIVSYGIYKVYNNNKEVGILRLQRFEEHNELVEYLNKFKNVEIRLKYDKNFNKWIIPTERVKDAIIRAY